MHKIILLSILATCALAQVAVPPISPPQPQGCNCSLFAVPNRIGCAQHLLSYGDNSTFCYVVDPKTCPSANISSASPGNSWRYCDPSVDPTPSAIQQLTIADIINNVTELSTLSLALQQPSLQSYAAQLNNASSNFTVFAPTNDAFTAAMDVLGLSSPQQLLNSTSLVPLLLLHVASGNYSSQFIQNNQSPVEIETLSPSLFSNVSVKYVKRFRRRRGNTEPTNILLVDAIVYDNNTPAGLSIGTYSLRSFQAINGNIYIIDNVIALRDDVATSIQKSPDFTVLSQALNKTGLYISALGYGSCPSPIDASCNVTGVTVWAPVDAAWLSLAQSLNTTIEDLLNNTSALTTVLQYHVSPMSQQPGGGLNLTLNQSIPTALPGQNITFINATRTVPIVSSPLLGGTIFAEVSGPVLSGNVPDNYASIDRSSTIEAYNGMVVPISSVLLPGNVLTVGGVGGVPSTEGEKDVVAAPNNY